MCDNIIIAYDNSEKIPKVIGYFTDTKKALKWAKQKNEYRIQGIKEIKQIN